MGTNIFIEMLVMTLFITAISNCHKRINQGIKWAYHISIILSAIIGLTSVFMLIVFTQTSPNADGKLDTIQEVFFWSATLFMAMYNLFTVKKININPREIIIRPLIGKCKKHPFCEAVHYYVERKFDYYFSWKELNIFFPAGKKIKISSIQHEEYVDIHNYLMEKGVPETFSVPAAK